MSKKITPIITAILSGSIAAMLVKLAGKKNLNSVKDELNKQYEFYQLLTSWLAVKQEGKSLTTYFTDNGYKTIAIYGMKELGERLYEELKDSEIEIKYVIDKRANELSMDIPAVTLNDELADVDVIVITAIHYFNQIEKELSDKGNYEIVSLEDIVYSMY